MERAAFDFETKLIKPGLLAPPPVCLTWRTPTELMGCHCQLTPSEAEDQLETLFSNFILFGANTAYDSAVAMNAHPDLIPLILNAYAEGRVRDIQLDQKLIDNAKGQMGGYADHTGRWHQINYSLGDLAKRHLKIDLSAEKTDPDAWRMNYWKLWDTPWDDFPDAAREYALGDSDHTYQIQELQQRAGEVLIDSAHQARAALSLHLMSCWGVKTDPDRIEDYREHVKDRLEELDDLLVDEGLVRANGTRNMKAAKALMIEVCEDLNIPVKLTKTGITKLMVRSVAPGDDSVDWDIVKKYVALDADACDETGDEILESYSERVSLYNIHKNKIPALLKGVHTPLQARFNPLVATGRTSCSMGKGGPVNGYQLQNPERKGPIRECFIARPGYLFADADLDTFELCTVSQVCIWAVGFSQLGDAINAGLDPHMIVTGKRFPVTIKKAKRTPVRGVK